MPQEKKTDDKKILPNKRDWNIVPLSFFAPVVDVFQEAGKKYGRCSWMHCEPEELDQKYLSAALRHIAEYADGNQIDRDSGHPHLAHAMANLGILQWHREKIAATLTNEHNFGGCETPEVYGDTEVPVAWIGIGDPRDKETVYVAGPMRGKPRLNYPAFYAAERDLENRGYNVINPARLDEDAGFDPDTDTPTKEFLNEAMERDVKAIVEEADCIVLLPGWRGSTGATAEAWLARWKHIPLLEYPNLITIDPKSL